MRNNPDGSLTDDYATGVEEAYRQFGDHPAVFGFHIGDEPHKDHKAAFAQAAKSRRKLLKHCIRSAIIFPGGQALREWLITIPGMNTWMNFAKRHRGYCSVMTVIARCGVTSMTTMKT